jgi:hypothetical protein
MGYPLDAGPRDVAAEIARARALGATAHPAR